MAAYIVMEPPGAGGSDRTGQAILVRDGFHFAAFVAPPLWLVWHRLWIEALLALAVGIALGVLGEVMGFGLVGTGLSLLVGLYVGLEGAALRVNALRRRGWHEWGVVEGDRVAEAEIRYLSEAAAERPEPDIRPQPSPPAFAPRAAQSGPALGLLHYPGKA
jgi:hypothetical protein